MHSPRPKQVIFVLVTFVFLSSPAVGQITFYTDDADTTPKGKFHIEFFNEHDWLQIFTGNGSLVRDFTDKLKLGVEVFGGVTNDFNLSRGQLQAQIGGSYALRDDFAVTFGVLGGRFPASPRVGIHVGFAYDLK